MKDKTDSMNMGSGGDGAVNGYTDAGTPRTERERKNRQLEWAGLKDDKALAEFENTAGQVEEYPRLSGFLPRHNYTDRN